MCGLVGIFDPTGQKKIDAELLAKMNNSQRHRGPDDFGTYIEKGIGLGHRRLSIIDLAGGHQPMYSQDKGIIIVYNGEIYNFQLLRKKLIDAGYHFRTQSDTEVIIHGWREWGKSCVEKFRGMFAFAIWDRVSQTLFLARDRLGIKPLYYSQLPDGQIIFGSELKSIIVHPHFPREIEPCAVEDYFTFGYIPDPKTIFKHANKLSPATMLTIHRGAKDYKLENYWDVSFKEAMIRNETELKEELIFRLQEAVRMRLISDVSLGAFLSGGVDSSAVVALMAGLSNEPVNTCSISFGDVRYNESAYANHVAKQYRTNHKTERVDENDFDLIDTLIGIYDEPYADSSAMPTYRVCQLARKYVTVALSGDGGDESFAGYRRYRWHSYEEQVRSLLPRSFRVPIFNLLGRTYPKLDWAPKILRAKSTFQALGRDSLVGYLNSVSIISSDVRVGLFRPSFERELQGYRAIDVLKNHADRASTDHPLSLVQYLDYKTYLPGDILTKVDRASMSHGLEVRVPILDHEFVDWVSSLSPDLKLKGRTGKYIFKQALEAILPQEILYRQKMGFAIPLSSWIRGPLKQRVKNMIGEGFLAGTEFFNNQYLNLLVEEHISGEKEHSAVIWALLMFNGFCEQLLDSNTIGTNSKNYEYEVL
jgi:asparagine synthase (glutamine-hydrolysing)